MSGIFDDSLVGSGWFVSDIPASGMFDEDMLRSAVVVSSGNYTLSCEAGNFTLAGSDAVLNRGHSLTSDAGGYTLSGAAATLTYAAGLSTVNYSLTCDPGTYALNGQAATANYARSITASPGAYALAGGVATFTRTISLSCSAGSFVLSGGVAQFNRTIKLEANNVYGSGRQVTREDVEKHWELIALRDQEEARHVEQRIEQPPVDVPAVESAPIFHPSSIPSLPFIQAQMAVTVAQSTNDITSNENEAIARARKQREEEALIVLLMEM